MTPGPQAGVFASGCEWELVDEDAMVPPTISLGVMQPGGKDYYDRYFADMNDNAGYKPIDGLGDIAVDADFGAVHVVSGDAFFQVQYIGGRLGGRAAWTLCGRAAARGGRPARPTGCCRPAAAGGEDDRGEDAVDDREAAVRIHGPEAIVAPLQSCGIGVGRRPLD